jgi:hypothetical protein
VPVPQRFAFSCLSDRISTLLISVGNLIFYTTIKKPAIGPVFKSIQRCQLRLSVLINPHPQAAQMLAKSACHKPVWAMHPWKRRSLSFCLCDTCRQRIRLEAVGAIRTSAAGSALPWFGQPWCDENGTTITHIPLFTCYKSGQLEAYDVPALVKQIFQSKQNLAE